MKLLLILSIEEYKDSVRKILAREGVPVYSETDIHGFKVGNSSTDLSNWFAQAPQGTFSKLFFSIQSEDSVKRVMKAIEDFNREDESNENYPIHAYQLGIENYV